MKISEKEKELLQKISLLTGLSKNDVESVFESMLVYLVMDFSNKKTTYVPFLGQFKFDVDLKNKDINYNFILHDFIVSNIKQVMNEEESQVEKILKNRIYRSLGEYLNVK